MFVKWSAICSVCFGIFVCDGFASQDTEPEPRKKQQKEHALLSNQDHGSVGEAGSIGASLFQRLDISANVFHSKGKGNASARTIIPLSSDPLASNVFFAAPGITYYQNRMTYNLGVGFRHFNDGQNLYWGLNSFFDYDSKGGNKRVSEGFEVGVPYVSVFGNFYQGLSGSHTSKVDKYRNEKTANGYDVKLHVTLPVYPQVAVSARYFSWQGKGVDLYGDKKYSDSPNGFVYGVEYKPIDLLGVSVQRTFARRQHSENTAVYLNLTYDFNRPISDQIAFNYHPEPYSLASKAFSQVDREYGIVLQTKSKLLAAIPLVPALPHSSDEQYVFVESDEEIEEEIEDELLRNLNGASPPLSFVTAGDQSPPLSFQTAEDQSQNYLSADEGGSPRGLHPDLPFDRHDSYTSEAGSDDAWPNW